MGGTAMGDYVPLLEEELALRGDDRRGPQWRKADLAPDTDFRVVVIGAGMSGILTAYRLAQAGVDYTVVEKNADVGGTWFENTYPGCRVDNPNHNYSYSFAQRHDWPLHYSDQRVLHEYFRDCARDFGVLEHIRFRTEVRSATWDDADRDVVRRRAHSRRHRRDARRQRGRQRGRAAQPPALPRDPRHRHLRRRRVPLRAVGSRRADRRRSASR